MTSYEEPRIISAQRFDGGVIVDFSDGRSAIYSASLLLSFRDQADEVPEENQDED